MSVKYVQPVLVNIPATAVTAGTPVPLFTPKSVDKFRLIALDVSLSVAGSVLFKDATTEVLRTPLLAAGSGTGYVPLDVGQWDGLLSTAAGNALQLDVSASGSVSGFVIVREE